MKKVISHYYMLTNFLAIISTHFFLETAETQYSRFLLHSSVYTWVFFILLRQKKWESYLKINIVILLLVCKYTHAWHDEKRRRRYFKWPTIRTWILVWWLRTMLYDDDDKYETRRFNIFFFGRYITIWHGMEPK